MLIQGQEGHTCSVHPDQERVGTPARAGSSLGQVSASCHGMDQGAPPPWLSPPPALGSDPLFRRTKGSWPSSGSC